MKKKETKVKNDKLIVDKNYPWQIGKNYVIRTVTMIQVGRLKSVHDHELVLEDAAWVADTGRWNAFLSTGVANDVEPFPDGLIIVGRGAIIDSTIWKHPLLRVVK